ncbi:MAG: dUTP diphosphatase [Parcubacteria group bacterium]|nr:dUTP diphosphatase [Parcubacteria group bacterium]
MKVRIKRIDKALPLPEYKTEGAVAFDFASRIEIKIAPRAIAYAPLNVVIEPPEGFMLLIAARSSLHKKGLMLANSVAIMDRDFCGDEDEYYAVLYNFSDTEASVSRGERIAQGIFKEYKKAEWEETDTMKNPSRGGFGTTGSL